MSGLKYIAIFSLFLAIGSCTTEKKAFQKRIMFDVEKGYHLYIVVPANVNGHNTELCLLDDDLRYFTIKDGKELDKKEFLSLLKKAINDKYIYSITDTSGLTKAHAANDSIYNSLDKMGLKNATKKYIDPEFERINWDSVSTDEERHNLIRYLFHQNHKVTYGDFSGSRFVISPPHKLPSRAIQKLKEAPFRKQK